MLKIKVAIQLSSLKLPFKKSLIAAAQLGADAVEIDGRKEFNPNDLTQTGIRHFRKQLSDLDLKISAVRFQTRSSYYDDEGLDRRVDATKNMLKVAYDLGASVVVNQIGTIPDDTADPKYQTLLQTISDIGRTGQRVGATLCARTGTEEGSRMRTLLNDLPQGSLNVAFDPGNLIIHGYSATEAIKALASDVWHTYAHDGVQDLAQSRGIEVPLGQGTADFPNILGILEEQGYNGYFTVQRDQADEPLIEVGQAVQFLRNIG